MTPALWISLGCVVGFVSVIALAFWLLRRRPPEIAATTDEDGVPMEIVVPTCGECGAVVWENREHGNTFCQEGHEDPEIILKPIEDFDE